MSKHIFLSLLAAIFFAPVVQASTLTFNSVASGGGSTWTLECSDCNMLAFLDNDGEAYDIQAGPLPLQALLARWDLPLHL